MLPLLVALSGITWACNDQVDSLAARHLGLVEPKEDLKSFYLWWGTSVIYHLGREEMNLYVRMGHLIWKEIKTIQLVNCQLVTSGRDLRKAPDSRCVVAPSPVWLRNH